MRINWFSNSPWASTGYGNQTRLFTSRLKDAGYEMSITAFYGLEGGILHWHGMPVYPKANHPYGQDIMFANAQHAKADLIIALLDAWVVEPELGDIPLAMWYPVDSEPIPAAVAAKVQKTDYRIVFTKFGEQQTNMAGMDCYYVPHGVDTKIYKPVPQSEAREKMKLDDDMFIVGMVAANKGTPSRKAFPENLAAFAQFKRKHRNSLLYLHTCMAANGENGGVNLPEYCNYLGLKIGRDVLFVDQYAYHIGLPEPYMVNAYSAMDVLLMSTMGEGFGIPTVEAQACGCPVIVGDWTAHSELCFGGWKIPKEEAAPWWTPVAGYQFMPRVESIVEQLENAYRAKGKQHVRQAARAGALDYDADDITERYWKPVLTDIAERINNGKDSTPAAD